MRLGLTIGGAFGLATLVLAMLNGQGEPVPLPRPRPAPPPLPEPSQDLAVDARWPLPVETVRFTRTTAVQSKPRIEPDESEIVTEPVERKRKLSRRERKAFASDICRGKGRYYMRGGRSWRCRR